MHAQRCVGTTATAVAAPTDDLTNKVETASRTADSSSLADSEFLSSSSVTATCAAPKTTALEEISSLAATTEENGMTKKQPIVGEVDAANVH